MAAAVGHVVLTLAFEQEDNKWVGTCIELGTSTFSRTLRQTQDDLRKLVVEHLNLLEQHGERESFFQAVGHRTPTDQRTIKGYRHTQLLGESRLARFVPRLWAFLPSRSIPGTTLTREQR